MLKKALASKNFAFSSILATSRNALSSMNAVSDLSTFADNFEKKIILKKLRTLF